MFNNAKIFLASATLLACPVVAQEGGAKPAAAAAAPAPTFIFSDRTARFYNASDEPCYFIITGSSVDYTVRVSDAKGFFGQAGAAHAKGDQAPVLLLVPKHPGRLEFQFADHKALETTTGAESVAVLRFHVEDEDRKPISDLESYTYYGKASQDWRRQHHMSTRAGFASSASGQLRVRNFDFGLKVYDESPSVLELWDAKPRVKAPPGGPSFD